jgi:hypothetical protein
MATAERVNAADTVGSVTVNNTSQEITRKCPEKSEEEKPD